MLDDTTVLDRAIAILKKKTCRIFIFNDRTLIIGCMRSIVISYMPVISVFIFNLIKSSDYGR